MRVLRPMIAVLILVLGTQMALAGNVGKGAIELNLRGAFDHSSAKLDGEDQGSFSFLDFAGTARFSVHEMFAIGGSLLFQRDSISPEGGESASDTAFGAAIEGVLNLATESAVIPYATAGVGIVTWSGDSFDSADIDPENNFLLPRVAAGIRMPVGNSASVNVELGWQHQTNAGGFKDVNTNDFFLGLGVSAFPKGFAPEM